jgi:outer membrane immunogenic protein
MKKFLLATWALIVIAAAQPAHAADQSPRPRLPTKTPIVPPAPIYNWTGCYIGAHGGGGAVSDNFVGFAFFGNANRLHGGNGFAGGQIGCNYQNGAMVVGLEGEAWSGLTNHQHFSAGGLNEDFFTRNRWSADVAVRAGVAFDRALLYGKAGVAEGRFAFSGANNFGGFANGAATLTGVLLAVGLEYGFAPNWSAKLEYDHIEYPDRVVHIDRDALDGGPFDRTRFASVNLIKAGINYRFGGLPFVPDSAPSHPAIYKALPSKTPPSAFSWTGCYAGVHAGGGWMGASNNSAFVGGGGTAGGQLGCNLQAGAIVWGVEGEAAWSGLTDSFHASNSVTFSNFDTRNRWSADVTARAGIAVDRTLVYGKAGLAAGGFDFSTQNNIVPDSQHGSGTLAGLLFGGGIEYAVTPNWSVKLEYDHIDYFERNVTIADPFTGPFTHSEGATANVLKLGANYRFADVPFAPAVDRAGTGSAILKAPAYKAPAPASNWTGCYVGVHGGGGILADTNNFSANDALPIPESSGGFVGGQVGCDYQTGAIVWGLQGEGAWSRILANFNNSLSTVEVSSDLVWSADAAVRAGVAIDRGLFYGKAGVAVGGFEHFIKDSHLGSEQGSTTLTGLLLAGGVEYAFAPNWSAFLEYDRIVYAGGNQHFDPTSGTFFIPFNSTLSAIVTEAKAGINYRFGGSALPPTSNRSQNLLPSPVTDWTGCYAGVHAGGGVISDTFTSFDNGNFTTVDGGGALAGGQAGCNYQAGMVVVGVEGDVAWSNIANRFNNISSISNGNSSDRNRWSADVAARGGIAFDHALLYGKAGVAGGRFDFFTSDSFGDFFEGGATLTGLLLGLGVEYAFAPSWSVKLEYDHVGYLARNIALGTFNTSESVTTNTVKAAINYKFFGPSAVVVARD